MDLAYVRAHPHLLPTFLTHQRIRETPVRGGSICYARRLTLEDGVSLFAKSLTDPAVTEVADMAASPDTGPAGPPEFFASEAAGLRWLAEANAIPVPAVIAVFPHLLVLEWVDSASPTAGAAERCGRDLAHLHRAGSPGWGAPWIGYIGSLPQDNRGAAGLSWALWFAERRLRPYLKMAADRGALSQADVAMVDEIISRIDGYGHPVEPPARLHGDLWPGNLLWAADRVWLVDPAAHGGSRETDLAQLALFGGAPYLDRLIAAYDEVWPLADGWRERVPLHQLQLLLVHAALFGTSYREAVVGAASAARRLG